MKNSGFHGFSQEALGLPSYLKYPISNSPLLCSEKPFPHLGLIKINANFNELESEFNGFEISKTPFHQPCSGWVVVSSSLIECVILVCNRNSEIAPTD